MPISIRIVHVCDDFWGEARSDRFSQAASLLALMSQDPFGFPEHYSDPAAWTWQKREEYRDSGQTRTDASEATMWTFEPGVALKIFHAMIAEARIPVVYRERLDLARGVEKQRTERRPAAKTIRRPPPARAVDSATHERTQIPATRRSARG